MWLISALFSAWFAALVAILAKLGLKTIEPTLVTTIRAVVMASFLLIFTLLTNKLNKVSLLSLQSKDWILVLLAGVAGALSWLFYFFALKQGLASRVSAVDRLSLVFVVILASLFLGERLTLKIILGAVLMILGAVLISF